MKRFFSFGLAVLLMCSTAYAQETSLSELKTLDLETAQRIALADNPSLAAAAERVEQALQRIKQSKALYHPTLGLTGSAGYSRLSESSTFSEFSDIEGSGFEIDRDQERYQLSLVADWLVFDGFSRKFTNLIAQYGGEESEQARRDGQRVLLQSVAESYYNAHLALYNITIAEANMDFNQQQLDEAEYRYQFGAGSLSNVLNFKVQINRAKTSLLSAKRDYEIALYSLAVLLGDTTAKLPENLTLEELEMIENESFFEFEVGELITKAIDLRPDIQQTNLLIDQSEAAIGNAKAPFYPTFGLRGSFDADSDEDAIFEDEDFGSSIALTLNYNLYRGGADKARVVEAKSAKREAVRLLEQQKNQVSGDVRRSYANLQLAQEQLLLQRSTADLVTQTRDLVQEGYNAGQESLVRLNEAQRDLVETQSNLALSLVGLYRFRYDLITVTGESLLPFYPVETE